MLSTAKRRAIVQLFAIALHTFLLGFVVLASVSQVSDRDGAYRPARESQLAALDDFIDGTALNGGVKLYDSQSPAGFLVLGFFRQFQVYQSAILGINNTERIYRLPTAGALPIRSPPSQLPL
jgi:hypothetical protein